MAVSLTELCALRDALVKSRAKGLRLVEYSGQRVEYKSDAEMAAALKFVDQQISSALGTSVVRAYNIIPAKGL